VCSGFSLSVLALPSHVALATMKNAHLCGARALQARAERDTQMRSRAQMQKQLEEQQLVEANPELASLSERESDTHTP